MRILTASCLLLLAACATSLRSIPEAWRTVPETARVTDLCTRVTCAEKPKSEVRVAGGRLYNGERGLTPEFATIQSFDVSLERGEVVFSARRGDNFDVGLVALEGIDVHWIPSDRADETDVQWAPRGNKVSYVVHAARGDLVRTVHIPTSAQLSADFVNGQVDALAWEPAAERYAVIVESADASQRIESMKYDGGERRIVVPAAERLDAVVEPLGGALVLRPSAIRYNEKLPLVVWIDEHPMRWNDARAALLRNARVAVAGVAGPPADAFWNEVSKTKWLDEKRTYVVGARGRGKSIVEDSTVPEGFYRDEGDVVRAGKVQSFAAGYIAHELNTNGLR